MSTGEINWSNIQDIDPNTLTPEQREEYYAKRTEYLTEQRNQALTDAISGNDNPVYNNYKKLKDETLAKFNELHEQVLTVFDPNYTKSLNGKSSAKTTLNKSKSVWTDTRSNLHKYQIAGQNLSQTGNLGDIKLNTTITDPERLKSYVTTQEGTLAEQEKIDYASYIQAQQDYETSYNTYQLADTNLGNAISRERSYVDDMRYLDERMMHTNIDYSG